MQEHSEAEAGQVEVLTTRSEAAWRAWQLLRLRLTTITPGRAAQLLLIVGTGLLILWLVVLTWTVLKPFVVGLFLAYVLLPLVNALSRHLPRWLAALLVFSGMLLLIGLGLSYLVPPLLNQIAGLLGAIPAPDETVTQLERWYRQLPPQAQESISAGLRQTVTTLRSEFVDLLTGLGAIVLNVLSLISFVIGLLVVPLFLYYVLMEQAQMPQVLDPLLPPALRPDFWAVARIIDRNFSGYIRSQILLVLIATLGTFITLQTMALLGVAGITYSLVLSVLVGLSELIPYIGVVLSTLAAIAIGSLTSWQTALLLGLIVFVIKQISGIVIYPILASRSVRMSEALIIIVLIMLSEFGLVFAILAPPIAATFRDLLIYSYGRLADPPRPAGLLPGEPLPAARSLELRQENTLSAERRQETGVG